MRSILKRAAKSRMVLCLVLSLALMVAALVVPPGNVAAVTLYKLHLMSLGGWGGYWLDRALFPYDRPHTYLDAEIVADDIPDEVIQGVMGERQLDTGAFSLAMLRRAVIVAACLLCVGLGA